jgi:hypothetical protein
VRLSGSLRALAILGLSLLAVGCAGVTYQEQSSLIHTRYATVENFGDEIITADQLDGLLEEVAEILNVTLDPAVPKVRVLVTSPSRIGDLYRQVATVAPHGPQARALYLPGANLVLVPSYERSILGHELAHYLTDHYLKSTPRSNWERLAYMVEDTLPSTSPRTAARRRPDPDALTGQAALLLVEAPAN